MANISYTKSYLLDKYFSELQKFQEKPPQELVAILQRAAEERGPTNRGSVEQAPDKPLPKPPPSPNYVNQAQTRILTTPAPPPAVEDLVQLRGTLITEDSLLRTLESVRDTRGHVHCGPQLLLFNGIPSDGPYSIAEAPSPLPAFTTRVLGACTSAPQTVILSGSCGSGKTHAMLQILRELFKQAPATGAEIWRGLQASITVARAMGAIAPSGSGRGKRGECSRVGHYVDLQLTGKTINRAKLHLYFLDNSRLTARRTLGGGPSNAGVPPSNYRVFYQLLAGLTLEEKRQLHLDRDHYTYLGSVTALEEPHARVEDAARFAELRDALKELGIPVWEVFRLLAAILLLGEPNSLPRIASLLDVRESVLRAGLETRTSALSGGVVRAQCDAAYSRWMRDQLAKALYVRTFGTIIRRANNVGRARVVGASAGAPSEYSSHFGGGGGTRSAGPGTGGGKEAAMTALNNFIRQATDNSIGVLDLFGFEGSEGSRLESLCVNLAAETMQHFYNTHVFKAPMEALREEGLSAWEGSSGSFEDNVPVIDLISSLRTGLLSILDALPPTASSETYLSQVASAHAGNPRLLSVDLGRRSFVVQHFAGRVEYDATDFGPANRDHLPDDLVSVFHKAHCSFGFASHLFSTELKLLGGPEPRGLTFRVTPSSSTASRELMERQTEPISTLTQDFHTRLDNLLRTLVHARPHFVRCFRSAEGDVAADLRAQARAFQLLETVEFYVAGFPNKNRLRAFATKYGVKVAADKPHGYTRVPSAASTGTLKPPEEACRAFLDEKLGADGASAGWAVGKKHVFLSEPARQALEAELERRRRKAAIVIQRQWRRWRRAKARARAAAAAQKAHEPTSPAPKTACGVPTSPVASQGPQPSMGSTVAQGSGRPAPIAGSPQLEVEGGLVERTCQMFGLDKDRPPSLPQPRSYTVKGATKFGYPQLRVMRSPFPDLANPLLQRKELVTVVGISNSKSGHLIVDKNGSHLEVPFQFLEFGCKEGVE